MIGVSEDLKMGSSSKKKKEKKRDFQVSMVMLFTGSKLSRFA